MTAGPRVDFYILKEEQPQGREQLCCRLVEKVYHLGHRAHLHCESQAQAKLLDDLLWSFKQGSFIPHEIIDGDQVPEAPVTIGFQAQTEIRGDVLINLTTAVPTYFRQFGRIAELVDGGESGRNAGRERYRYYRAQNCVLHSHDLDG